MPALLDIKNISKLDFSTELIESSNCKRSLPQSPSHLFTRMLLPLTATLTPCLFHICLLPLRRIYADHDDLSSFPISASRGLSEWVIEGLRALEGVIVEFGDNWDGLGSVVT